MEKFEEHFVIEFYFAGIISVRSTHLWEKGRIRSRIRIRTADYWIREARKQADPADPDPIPDPQLCFFVF